MTTTATVIQTVVSVDTPWVRQRHAGNSNSPNGANDSPSEPGRSHPGHSYSNKPTSHFNNNPANSSKNSAAVSSSNSHTPVVVVVVSPIRWLAALFGSLVVAILLYNQTGVSSIQQYHSPLLMGLLRGSLGLTLLFNVFYLLTAFRSTSHSPLRMFCCSSSNSMTTSKQQQQQQQRLWGSSMARSALLVEQDDLELLDGNDEVRTDRLLLDQSMALSASAPSPSKSRLSLNAGRLLVIVASAIYGTNFAAVKLLDQLMPMSLSASLRFSLAAGVSALLVLAREPRTSSALVAARRWEATLAGGEVGVWYCIGYIAQASGLHTAGASKSAFFNALAVMVVPLLDAGIKGKPMGMRKMISVGMALLGVAALQLGPTTTATAVGSSPTMELLHIAPGDLFCLAQALFFGIGYWRLEAAATEFPDQAGRATVGQLTAVALGSLIFLLGTEHTLPSLHALRHWLTDPFIVETIVWTGLISTALAMYLETVALKVVSASELTILMTSVSVFGSAFAYVTMGETMDAAGVVGGLLILAGCLVSATGTAPAKKVKDDHDDDEHDDDNIIYEYVDVDEEKSDRVLQPHTTGNGGTIPIE